MSDFSASKPGSNEQLPLLENFFSASAPSMALVVVVDKDTNQVVEYRTQPLHEVAAIVDLLQSNSSSASQPQSTQPTLEE